MTFETIHIERGGLRDLLLAVPASLPRPTCSSAGLNRLFWKQALP